MDIFITFLTVFGYACLVFFFGACVYIFYKIKKIEKDTGQASDSLSDFCDKLRHDMEQYNDNNNDNN